MSYFSWHILPLSEATCLAYHSILVTSTTFFVYKVNPTHKV
jgi:hypothetical protein